MKGIRELSGSGYPVLKSGEIVGLPWKDTVFKMACCDCGLVHDFRFNVKKKMLFMIVDRNNRATALIRRHHKKKLPCILR